MNNEDTKTIGLFLGKIKAIFEGILKDDGWFLDESLKKLAQNAWEEVSPILDKLNEEIKTCESSDIRFVIAGLCGNQLKFKLNAFDYFHKNGLTKKILGAINSILGSLISVFPLAESIKEFKDFLELSRSDG